MYTSSIKISELDYLNVITADDFFPLVDSGSLTTYHTDITTLNTWWAASGSALSASWAPMPGEQISCSWASSSVSSSFSSIARQSISASYVSGSQGIINNLTSPTKVIIGNGNGHGFNWPSELEVRGAIGINSINGANDWATIYTSQSYFNGFTDPINGASLYFEMADDGSEGFYFVNRDDLNTRKIRRLSIEPHVAKSNISTLATVHGDLLVSPESYSGIGGYVTASKYYAYTSSNTVGFVGTASWAQNAVSVESASYAHTASFTLRDTLPVGTIIAYGGETIPNNWLECNGAILLTSSYSELYTAISSSDANAVYGYLCDSFGNRAGSPKNYFKLPDFRGEFLRGLDNLRGVDSGRAAKTYQSPSLGEHWHGVGEMSAAGDNNGRFISRGWDDGNTYNGRAIDGEGGSSVTGITNPTYPLGTSNAVGNLEQVRPRNVAVTYLIKYSNASNYANLTGVTLAGDVQGNYAATTVVGIQNIPVTSSAPSNDQVLAYNTSSNMWAPKSLTINSFVKAFGTFYTTGDGTAATAANNFIPFSGSYNFISASAIGTIYQTPGTNGMTTSSIMSINIGNQDNFGASKRSWIVHMETPLPTINYTVVASIGGSQPSLDRIFMNFPLSGRTTTAFTMSCVGNDNNFWDSVNSTFQWVTLMVLHP